MIDIHVHILSGLDDGAQTIEDSLQMADRALSDQVKCLVATPHTGLWGAEVSPKLIEDGVEELRGTLRVRGAGLNVLPGSEVLISPAIVEQVHEGKVLTLNKSRYVLLELPYQMYPRYTDQVLFELQVKGYAPILAHPERYGVFQKDIGLLCAMVERGILAQLTAGSLAGMFGKKVQHTAETMLEHNLVHVIASDAHSPDTRAPILSAAVEHAARIVGREQAIAMVTSVPEAIINNELPQLLEPVPAKQKRGWAIWR